jgi:SAM-dependent methyltransferase
VKKWWERRTAEDIDERLARVNASSAVRIEVVGAPEAEPGSGDLGAWSVDEDILREEHHHQYGRPWATGKYVFEFAVAAGLRPEHRLLDFGCGALRVGVWAIPYLDAGNYFGVDSHVMSLEAATTYEIPFHGLEAKRPRLLWNDDFEFSHFGTTFDMIVDFASSSHFKKKRRRERIFSNYVDVLAPGGRVLTSPPPDVSAETLAEWGLALVRGDVVQQCPLLEGHEEDFRSHNVWSEYRRADEAV